MTGDPLRILRVQVVMLHGRRDLSMMTGDPLRILRVQDGSGLWKHPQKAIFVDAQDSLDIFEYALRYEQKRRQEAESAKQNG